MNDSLERLRPEHLWRHFAAIAAIPRPSKQEERIVNWVRDLAAENGWQVDDDEVGNLVLRVPATRGYEGSPVVILQAHLDMVCEKNNDVEHDFTNDPIRTIIDGDWVTADGTTLGADNGIGVAAALASATDPEVVHGPLELLFTLDEETGLTGAAGLDGSMLQGRFLLNMDSEEDGKLCVGCAGGADCHLWLEPDWIEPAASSDTYRVALSGLRGGHSGIDIHENRGNAIKLLTRLMLAAIESGVELELESILGGSKHNAIPREAEARCCLSSASAEELRGVGQRMLESFRAELNGIDEGLEFTLEPSETPAARVMGVEDRDRMLGLLAALPHGVLGMSPAVPGLVETSNNLAAVQRIEDRFRIVTSSRSSVNSLMDAVLLSVRSAGRLAGARIETHDGYPGWKPDMDSRALAVLRKVYTEIWGGEIEVTAVHAGLECGLLSEKVPGLDMISFGPQIEGAHSPDERVQISSVDRFWSALQAALVEFTAA